MGYVNKISISDQTHLIEPTLYATAAKDEAAYTASIDNNFNLVSGVAVNIKFTATNETNATLNINNTGAKNIYYNNAVITANILKANHIYNFVYDGTNWQLIGNAIGTEASDAAAGNHVHGNITNDGKIGSAANYAVYTTTSGKLTAGSLAVTDSTASTNNTTKFVQAVTQDSKGQITVTKASLDTSGTWSGTATKATTTEDITNPLYPIGVTSSATTILKYDTNITMKSGAIEANKYKATHTAGGQQEFEVVYGSTIDMAFMVGTSNKNHGIYDYKKGSNGTWILSAGADNNWELNGNAATATTATTATYIQGIDQNTSNIDIANTIASLGEGEIRYDYRIGENSTGLFAHKTGTNTNAILTFSTASGANYIHQLGFSTNEHLYHRAFISTAQTNDKVWNEILDSSNYTDYAYDLNGSNTGTKLQISTQSAAYTNGIQFMNSTTKKGSIGTDNNGTLGIYGTKVVLRPQLDASTKGVEVTADAMYPTASITLGTASNKWSTVYATTFDGNATTATSSKVLANQNGTYGTATTISNRVTDTNNIAHVNNGGVTHFKVGTATNGPASGGNILHFYWDTSDAWDAQLHIPNNSANSMSWRASSAAGTWDSWRTLLDNENTTIPPTVPTLSWGAEATVLTINGSAVKIKAMDKPSYSWGDIGSKPIEFGTYSGALNTNGWKAMGARTSGAKIYIAYNNNPASWNSAVYSSSIVFGCSDTKGLLDIGHNNPIVTFGGASNGNGTDNDPKWYFKLYGTSGKTYTFPSDTKTLAAADGSNASGTGWAISITGSAGSVAWANTGHPDTFPPTIGTTATTAMAGNTNVTTVAIAANDTSSTDTFPVTYAATNTSTTTAKNDTLKKSTGKLYFQPSTGTLTATNFSGSLDGNASTASKVSATLNQTATTYLLGTQTKITASETNVTLTGDTGIYLTTTPGELSAYRYSWHYGANEKAYTTYNSTDDSIDFIFV